MRRIRSIATLAAVLAGVIAPLADSWHTPALAASASAFPSPLIGPVRYGASHWEVAPVDVPPTLDFKVSCWSTLQCLASQDTDAAAGTQNESLFLRSGNGGVSWMPVSTYNDGINDVSCFGTTDCMGAPFGGDAHILVTTDSGNTWTTIALPPFSPGLTAHSLACTTSACLVIGTQPSGHIPTGVVAAAVSTDLGKTWVTVTLPAHMSSVQAMSCAPRGPCYLVYDTSTHRFSDMAVTTDEGRTWKAVTKAPGFTSESGFSCPSARSCVYLANQVLEVTTNGARTWHADRGPFTATHSNAVSAFTLSCSSVSQCLIGGVGGKGAGQTVVWLEGRPWKSAQVHQALVALDTASTKLLVADGNTLSKDSGSAAAADFNALVSHVVSGGAAIDALALHARGSTQGRLLSIGHAWNVLLASLATTSQELNANKANTVSSATVSAEVRAILKAEAAAGGVGQAPGQLTP